MRQRLSGREGLHRKIVDADEQRAAIADEVSSCWALRERVAR
jgi:hypothetical protein